MNLSIHYTISLTLTSFACLLRYTFKSSFPHFSKLLINQVFLNESCRFSSSTAGIILEQELYKFSNITKSWF